MRVPSVNKELISDIFDVCEQLGFDVKTVI